MCIRDRIYGELSEEFQETIPDTAILKELYPDSQVSHLMKRGQNNFDGFPMVGVTQEQSRDIVTGEAMWSWKPFLL